MVDPPGSAPGFSANQADVLLLNYGSIYSMPREARLIQFSTRGYDRHMGSRRLIHLALVYLPPYTGTRAHWWHLLGGPFGNQTQFNTWSAVGFPVLKTIMAQMWIEWQEVSPYLLLYVCLASPHIYLHSSYWRTPGISKSRHSG